MSALTIRPTHDHAVLERLAALDSARPLQGDALVAEICGRAVAAIEVASGRTVADPFERTAQIVEVLRLRARGTPQATARRRGSPLPRPA